MALDRGRSDDVVPPRPELRRLAFAAGFFLLAVAAVAVLFAIGLYH